MKLAPVDALLNLSHSTLHNYILPGLESRLLGSSARIFVNTRESIGAITPHSHRFDFQCLVLQGEVHNTLFTPDVDGSTYQTSTTIYLDSPGQYRVEQGELKPYAAITRTYGIGDWYGMGADEIHTIRFSQDAIVLFIEGLETTKKTTLLEPFINGETIITMRTEAWMFRK